ncbi:hypothetical protein Ae168Ps1_4809c [Pseudonocardia sp. Ae168_Ps1]|uniref:hypothetical protein n=1 Tax=unclassified Pseudonocardia TaxID=2619320 RepID=UPI00094A9CF5|nr:MULTISPECIES: hypothetical protein [unclassified Pseudonocardia]OLL76393.1 hypothetical protein Ae150APs1_4771c [Pseudonocardia sp. Ae150A_Ps1]OLL82403.1 hypothetical protein Ae168Ps1_4809c [Pseudonocardia sp. Ae168_Ps1]OLL83482.1 hypothetical protein Ae263Ps1_0537 [Pseudonocardia sp. Ae263_Ps1]OLL90479.1 hypothetical protein Ae356Ps1_0376c [Pseudonocardia sp. Ae356_Ps1]
MTRSTHHRHGGRYGRGGHRHGPGGVAHRGARVHHGAARYDHRRERRLRRRGGPVHPVAAVALVSGAVLLTGTAVAVVVTVVAQILAILLVGLVVAGTWTWLKGAVRRPEAGPVTAVPAAAVTAEEAWRRARADFQRVRAEFAEHETDPMAVLHRPALSDVAVGSTARFVDAFAAAQALDTDGYPGEPFGGTYVRAVEQARRAWRAAVEAADRIRLSGLSAEERRTVERVVKLLTTARDSDSEPERLAAYSRARSELDRLDRAGVIHLPRPARAHLDARARGELPGT